MSWGFTGMLKNRSGMHMVSNRWEFVILLLKDYMPIGSRNILIQIFWNVTSSYLQKWACIQILTFLADFIHTLTWTIINT